MARTREFDTDKAIDQALKLFWQHGYEATTVQNLVEALGIGRASLYGAFGGKHQLYLAALAHYRDLMAGPALAALEKGVDARSTVRSLLMGRVEIAVADPLRRGCMFVNAAAECLPRDAMAGRMVQDVVEANQDALTEVLRSSMRRGEISDELDPAALAQFLIAVMNGLLVASRVVPDLSAFAKVVDVAVAAMG